MGNIRNLVRLIGNVGSDISIEETKNGKKFVQFSLAINNRGKNKNGEVEQNTNWFRVTAWNKTAELINQYLGKGDEVAIDGFLNSNSYEKDGEKRISVEVVVNEFLVTKKMQ